MTAESGSSRNSAFATKSPDAIQVNRCCAWCLSAGASSIRLATAPTATTNDPSTLPQAITEMSFLGNRLPRIPFSAEPASGNNGISQRYCIIRRLPLPLHGVRIVDAERLAVAVQSNADRKPDCRLRRGEDHDKEHKKLAVDLVQRFCERNKAEIHGIQHELDAEE